MSRIPQHIIDEIFQTARIEEVISSFVQLKKSDQILKDLVLLQMKKHLHL